MKFNKWTLGLAAVGVVSMASVVQADEKASSVMTALSSTTLSGYVDTSIQWNPGTGNANNPGIPFSGGKADGFNLNVVKLSLEKAADAADQYGAGYKVDLLFGPDATAFGTTPNSGGGFSGFAIKQAYVDLKAPIGNGLDIKLGVWDTIIGYEVFESGNNPNITRSYGYGIEPTTHTGVLLSYQVCEALGVSAGIANSFGPVINGKAHAGGGLGLTRAESEKTLLGSVSLTAPKDWSFMAGSTLYGGIINGINSGGFPGNGGATRQTSLYAGASFNTPVKDLKLGIAYDYAGTPKNAGLGVLGTYANAVGLYATYQWDKWSFNGRAEYSSRSGVPAIAFPSTVVAFTATIQYDLWKNVMSRLELRWDHEADSGGPLGTGAFGSGAFGAPDKKNVYEVIAQLIYKF